MGGPSSNICRQIVQGAQFVQIVRVLGENFLTHCIFSPYTRGTVR